METAAALAAELGVPIEIGDADAAVFRRALVRFRPGTVSDHRGQPGWRPFSRRTSTAVMARQGCPRCRAAVTAVNTDVIRASHRRRRPARRAYLQLPVGAGACAPRPADANVESQ